MSETSVMPDAGARALMRPNPSALSAARLLVWVQAPFLLLIAVSNLNGQTSIAVPLLCLLGAALLVAGGVWIGRDRAVVQPPHVTGDVRVVSWDWSDIVIFIPAAFTASSLLVSVTVPLVDTFTGGGDATVRTAAESFVAQASFYAGALFNVWVLASLRRGATLFDLGWRRFRWWWIPAAIVAAVATLYVADVLQFYSARLFPNAPNSQCVTVQHDYSHFVVLGVIVVCIFAPMAEETIFRGFIFGWSRRALPLVPAIALSAAIFALAHFEVLITIPLFAVGCILALVYQYSRSLFPGMVVHALFNLPGIIAILSSPSC